MALPMDEQRILAQIEEQLASADPALAARLSSFGGHRAARVLRSPRLRLVASVLMLVSIAVVSLVVYTLVPFRGTGPSVPVLRSSPGGRPAMTSRGATASASARPASPGASKASPASRSR